MNKTIEKDDVLDALISSYEHIYEKLQKNRERIREIKKELN